MNDYIQGENIKESYFFSSHPKLMQRINNFERLQLNEEINQNTPPEKSDEKFEAIVHELVIENAKLCLERGLFKSLENQLSRLEEVYAGDARVYLIKGDLYRKRQDTSFRKKNREKMEDYKISLEAYDKALRVDPTLSLALLGKGRVLHVLGKKKEALELYQRYLEAGPTADDKSRVEYLIRKAKEQ